jgi:hypothetical protein
MSERQEDLVMTTLLAFLCVVLFIALVRLSLKVWRLQESIPELIDEETGAAIK